MMAATLALLAAPFGVAPAVAAPPAPIARYVALGDSYAAGQGSAGQVVPCGVSGTTGYPRVLDQAGRINLLRDVACSGATVADLLSTQVAAVNRGTTLVTITVGANDLGASSVFNACVFQHDEALCAHALSDASAQVPVVLASMTQLIGTVRDRAPNATIVVTGYPVPFAAWMAAQYSDMAVANSVVVSLNSALAGVAASTGAVFAPVDFSGPYPSGHQYGDVDPWLGVDPSSPAFLHPTAAGDAAYAAVVQAVRP